MRISFAKLIVIHLSSTKYQHWQQQYQ